MAKTFTPSFYHKSVILQCRSAKCRKQTLSTPLRASVRRSAAFCARRRCLGGVGRVSPRKIAQERPCASLRALALCVRAQADCRRSTQQCLSLLPALCVRAQAGCVSGECGWLLGRLLSEDEKTEIERKSAADAALFRECVRAVLRRAPCAPCALLLRSRHPGNRGRSNTPWHTSCENSVQGGILQ